MEKIFKKNFEHIKVMQWKILVMFVCIKTSGRIFSAQHHYNLDWFHWTVPTQHFVRHLLLTGLYIIISYGTCWENLFAHQDTLYFVFGDHFLYSHDVCVWKVHRKATLTIWNID